MDKKKSSAKSSSSSSEKHGEKKDENFLTKTAHSIRDKVHELTDDVKEKTHNLTHSSDSKKKKNDKDHKKTDSKSKTSSKPPTAGKKDSGSDSDDEDESPKPTHPPATSSVPKKDKEQNTGKPNTLASKPSAPAAVAEKKDAAPSITLRKTLSDKPASSDSASKSSNDHKTAAPSSKPSGDNSAAKPSGPPSNNDSKPSTEKSNNAADGSGDTTNKASSGTNNNDHVHISFYGVSTVDDLLDRIDDTIERAKIIVENGKGTVGLKTERTTPRPTSSPADLDKKPVKKAEDDKNQVENKEEEENKKKDEDEPIRINYNEIHKIEDLLAKVNEQPGDRKVVLENAPDNLGSVTIRKQDNSRPTAPSTSTNSNKNDVPPSSTTTNENDDSSSPLKSILKTSQDPSSLGTSTKTSLFQDNQIHVNIEGVQSVDDLLDRIDDSIQHVPIVIDTKSQGEKRQAPQAPNQNDNNNPLITSASFPTQKREAPKAPFSTDEQNVNATKSSDEQEEDDNAPNFKIPDNEFPNKTSTSGKKKANTEPNEWI